METTEKRLARNLFYPVLLLVTISTYGAANIIRIGPDILPIVTTIDASAGSTFLVNDVVLGHGVLFAFSAFFVNTSKVRFQVWRPYKTDEDTGSGGTGAKFQLVFQAAMTPSVSLSREDFYIVSSLTHRCPVVQSGDTVGVFFESSPTAISRYFDPVSASTYRHQQQNADEDAQINDILTFDTLRFPYKLNLQAWIETSNDSVPVEDGSSTEGYVDCPATLIPSHVIEAITISPGMTGATGPTGPSGDRGAMGDTGPFGLMGSTGSTGSPGSTGDQGNAGATGATGPWGVMGVNGPEGYKGDTGLVGATGVNGEVGPLGPPGPPGSSAPVDVNKAASTSNDCAGFLMSESFLVGMIIWLCIVSLLLLTTLIIIVVLCLELRSKQRRDDNKDPPTSNIQPWITMRVGPTSPRQVVHNDYHQDTLPTTPLRSQLREEMESNFSFDTINTDLNASQSKAARKSSEEPAYAVLRDPSTTSMSEGGVYNPVYIETEEDNQPKHGLKHVAETSS